MAFDIGMGVGVRIGQRIAHTGLRRQVNDAGDIAVLGDQVFHRSPVGDIQAFEAETVVAAKHIKARLLQRNVIVIIEIIDTDNLVAPLKKRARGMETNESGGAGNQDSHKSMIQESFRSHSYTRSAEKNHPLVH